MTILDSNNLNKQQNNTEVYNDSFPLNRFVSWDHNRDVAIVEQLEQIAAIIRVIKNFKIKRVKLRF